MKLLAKQHPRVSQQQGSLVGCLKRATLTTLCLASLSGAVFANTTDGLVAYYKMDGDASDSSGNHLNGALSGTVPTDDRYGNHNKALLFNGISDIINCGNPAAFNFASDFTLSAWVKQSGSQPGRYLIVKYDYLNPGTAHDYGMGTAESAEPYGFVLENAPGYEDLRGTVALNDNAWHAMAVVFQNGVALSLYVDGVLNTSRAVGTYSPFVNNAAPLTIGATTAGLAFGGAMDDVRIFNCALSDIDISDMYDADSPKPPKPSKPVAYYKLDGDAKDSSKNHLDGYLNGTTPTTDRFGKKNKALAFNGSTDWIDCGNPAAFNFTGNFSLSAWVKCESTQVNRYLVAKYNPQGPDALHAYGLGLAGNSQTYGFVLGDGPGYQEIIGSAIVGDSAWHALSYVYEAGKSLRLYVDGAIVASTPAGNYPPFANSVSLIIGGAFTGPLFEGAIDDVRVYDRALPTAEVMEQFKSDSPRTSLSDGLVAYYPLNGNALDAGGSHLNGTLSGTAPVADRYGKKQRALSFNGVTDLINCGNPSQFNFSSNFTFHAWVKPDGIQFNRYIIAKYDPFGADPLHSYGIGTAGPNFPYGFVLGDGPGYEDTFGSSPIDTTKWHAVSMVFQSANSLRLYLDGTLVASRPVGAYPPFVNSIPLIIGGAAFPGAAFGGGIDDVRVYKRALSPAEIARLFVDESP